MFKKDYSNWKPTSENINNLPLPLRKYIMDLETLCDPAGIVKANILTSDFANGLQLQIMEISKTQCLHLDADGKTCFYLADNHPDNRMHVSIMGLREDLDQTVLIQAEDISKYKAVTSQILSDLKSNIEFVNCDHNPSDECFKTCEWACDLRKWYNLLKELRVE